MHAITVRGIGSYLHGARLEIRPLTVLCGTNGSGKPTWFKVLNMLKDSISANNCFPFGWSANDRIGCQAEELSVAARQTVCLLRCVNYFWQLRSSILEFE